MGAEQVRHLGESDQPKRNLFVIEAEVQSVAEAFDRLEELGTEDAIQATVMGYFGEVYGERDRKIDNYVRLIRAKIAQAEMFAAEAIPWETEAKRLRARAKTCENIAKRLKDLLVIWMKSIDMKSHETSTGNRIRRQNNSKASVKIREDVRIEDYRRSPWVKATYEWDTDAIRDDLKAGIEIPFATLELGEHARIS